MWKAFPDELKLSYLQRVDRHHIKSDGLRTGCQAHMRLKADKQIPLAIQCEKIQENLFVENTKSQRSFSTVFQYLILQTDN